MAMEKVTWGLTYFVQFILQRPGSVIVFITFYFLKKGSEYDSEILLDFSLTVKAATLIFIFGRGSAISSTKEGNQVLFIIW